MHALLQRRERHCRWLQLKCTDHLNATPLHASSNSTATQQWASSSNSIILLSASETDQVLSCTVHIIVWLIPRAAKMHSNRSESWALLKSRNKLQVRKERARATNYLMNLQRHQNLRGKWQVLQHFGGTSASISGAVMRTSLFAPCCVRAALGSQASSQTPSASTTNTLPCRPIEKMRITAMQWQCEYIQNIQKSLWKGHFWYLDVFVTITNFRRRRLESGKINC